MSAVYKYPPKWPKGMEAIEVDNPVRFGYDWVRIVGVDESGYLHDDYCDPAYIPLYIMKVWHVGIALPARCWYLATDGDFAWEFTDNGMHFICARGSKLCPVLGPIPLHRQALRDIIGDCVDSL